MDTDKYERMSFDECLRAMELTKKPTTDDEVKIARIKQEWIENFKPLLQYKINRNKDEKISSPELTELWLFYTEGIRVRKMFSKLNQDQLYDLLMMKNPIDFFLTDDVDEITRNGVFLYQVAYYITVFKYKVEESVIRHQSIYSCDDPIEWFKNNNHTSDLSITNKSFVQNHGTLIDLWRKIYTVSDLSLDPIFQK